MTTLNSRVPEGPIKDKWTTYKDHIDLVNPANKRNIDIILIGTGLAGGSAAATLAELGYNVKAFCYQDSGRRAHSIAAQGGINAAKNYQNDNDSVHRLFYDTIKGGDYRAREANVHRLAEVSGDIIDQCVAQGVPFAREYGGTLSNRSFGGVLVSRTFYARGQTGQQLLLGCYASMNRMIGQGKIEMHERNELLDIVIIDGKARGIITRNLVTGEIERHSAHAVVIATGGYGTALGVIRAALSSGKEINVIADGFPNYSYSLNLLSDTTTPGSHLHCPEALVNQFSRYFRQFFQWHRTPECLASIDWSSIAKFA